jgi:hypothetical protein
MAKTKILGTAVTITSAVKVADFKTLAKFKPAALALTEVVDGVKEEKFSVALGTGPSITPSVTKHGIVFNSENADGYAEVTLQIPASIAADKRKEYVADTYGYALLNLNQLEGQIAEVMAETEADFIAINDGIEVV